MQKLDIIHYPNLRTVLQVEKVLSEGEVDMTRNEIKRQLPTKIMHQTLNLILAYLEAERKIHIGRKGITWLQKDNKRLQEMLKSSVEVIWEKGSGLNFRTKRHRR